MADDEQMTIDTPWRRDPAELTEQLGAWARAVVGADATVAEVSAPEGNGMSSETVLFELHRGGTPVRHVARLAPLPGLFPVFPEYDLDLQARCMRLVGAATDVPVPEVPWYEPDPQWLGSPFLVMSRVDGRVPPDVPPYVFGGWVAELAPEGRAQLEANTVDVLARLHRVTPSTHDLGFLARPAHGASPLDQQLGYQRWYYEWAREGQSYPLIERTFAWLDAHRPSEGAAVLNWGDSRIGNMLFSGVEPVAVLDWEMATVGPKEIDIAWALFVHRFFDDLAERFEMPAMKDLMVRDRVVATYEAASGEPVRDLEWFEVFAALRFAIVSVRTTARGVAYGQTEAPDDPDDVIMFRGLQERMLAGTYWD
jgi:aminoglycoside phosphotransferase (APT) family kinase protein